MTTGACEIRLSDDPKTAPCFQLQRINKELQKLISCQQVLLGEFKGFKSSALEQLAELKMDIRTMSEVMLGEPSHRADDLSHVLGERKAEIVHNGSPPKPREVPIYLRLWSSEYRLPPSGSQLEHNNSSASPHTHVQSLSSMASQPTSPPLSLSPFLGNKIKNCLDISSKTYAQKLTTEEPKDGSFDLSFYERSKAMRSTGNTQLGQQFYSQKVTEEVGWPIYCESMRTTTEREQPADSSNTLDGYGMKTMVLPHLLQEVRNVTSSLKKNKSNKVSISRSRPESKVITHKANERLSKKGSLVGVSSKTKIIAEKPDVARQKGRTASKSQSHACSPQKEITVTSFDPNSRREWPIWGEKSPPHRVTQSRIQSSSKHLKTEESTESEATGAMRFTLRGWAASFLQPPGSNSSGSKDWSLQEGARRQQSNAGKENNARFSGRTSKGGCAWTLTEHAGS
ncbi:hypothetical protein O6H91_19G060600 [Diphasiastrum complanatum]|nr:hypothetical protein O6H91_19G060600 [Diphasiastrum complanatum]KAJ7521593.1 hypothetical protein O6H91_19G060600 [Diphasiastrum complanatum]